MNMRSYWYHYPNLLLMALSIYLMYKDKDTQIHAVEGEKAETLKFLYMVKAVRRNRVLIINAFAVLENLKTTPTLYCIQAEFIQHIKLMLVGYTEC